MTITEVSKKYGLSADTLRYYERVGLIPTVNRNKSGIRDYTQEDCNWVEFIKCMRGAGLPIEVLIDYVTMFQQGDSTVDERKALLIDQRRALAEKIEEMNKTLERLDYKIDLYEKGLIMSEKELREKNQ
ncbi:MAG TPA: MerR family transcriptional regulator [Terrisporobacter glycolicus]|uniref:MerR family transcriptional regulator n=2 Tax=Terrisporobacter TaxID=1505652 RepID=A0AAX2ZAV9_9FIRM|nr:MULTISPECIES: MerR family transcriptional regulator [Terrisporobacter]MBN9646899.1 MerR family transcriptional regulator [Terrisporobacter glycolicus]MCC3863873.1 MerR family transcriptional regulator [Terrisporobacter petrolearius]UEL46468.1 MerR family transcriptional regulator [Terrisporobacter hibernicus]UPA29903.1 MerR family transcriptional regulator [Terrisporobacter glycolicus]SFI94348.1 DNA-binding transcriptional regulator, MerR family [Terrisporobacter glycolicus]